MRDLIIVCAGGFGRDMQQIIENINLKAERMGQERPYRLLGFIDDTRTTLKDKNLDVPILGTIRDWQPYGEERYVMANATPKHKEALAKLLKSRSARFETLICLQTQEKLPDNVSIGEGCIITPYSLDQNTTVGDFVNLQSCAIGQDSVIGDYCTITAFANVTAHMGKRVFVGSHAVVLNHRRIGDDAVIGACSMVVNPVKAGSKVFGVPAKTVKL